MVYAGFSYGQSDGSLDLSFGNNGQVITDIGGHDYCNAICIQPDGKILIGGTSFNGVKWTFTLIRYNTDGILDNTFGNNGFVSTDLGGISDECYSIAIQSNGKIVAAGTATINNDTSYFALVRYNYNGSLDSTFNNNGIAFTDFGRKSYGTSVAIQPNDKIIVAGYSDINGNYDYDYAIARYNTDGTLDLTFDGDGKTSTDFEIYDFGYSLSIQPDGKIIVAGTSMNNSDTSYFALVRYNYNGSIDSTFGSSGKVINDCGGIAGASSVILQPDEKIIAAGFSKTVGGIPDFSLVRYNTDGSLDNNFNGNGIVITDFGGDDQIYSLALQSNGKIVAAGYTIFNDISGQNVDFAIARYNSDGNLDYTFGNNGKVTTSFGCWDYGGHVAIQSDGKIVVAGHSQDIYGALGDDYLLARYNSHKMNIYGVVFNDVNENGIKDSLEQGIAQHLVKLEQGPIYTTTDNNGYFWFVKDTGTYTISYIPQLYWEVTSDSLNYTISVMSTTDTISGLDFGVKARINTQDVGIYVTGSPARVTQPIQYWTSYKNWGTLTMNGTINDTYDTLLNYTNSNPAENNHSSNVLTWNYDTLANNEQRNIISIFQPSPLANIGDTIFTYCQIGPLAGDTNTTNNFDTLIQVILASFDPNDKQVSPVGNGTQGYVLHGQKLTYTVRFQNTGNDTAFTVLIRDTLDTDLDIETFTLLASSHSVNYTIEGTGIITFVFNNIMLPDSNVNYLASQGFVKYSVEPDQGLADYTEVINKAYIYFDNNPPILTNNVLNTYISNYQTNFVNIDDAIGVNIYPNPTTGKITVKAEKIERIEIMDIQGQKVRSQKTEDGSKMSEIDLSQQAKGIYIIKVTTEKGVAVEKIIKN